MNRIVGLVRGAIKKGCRKNQMVRGTISLKKCNIPEKTVLGRNDD